MNLFTIEHENCIDCESCIDVCPANILNHDDEQGIPSLIEKYSDNCINCFQCEAACPTDAFKHTNSSLQEKGSYGTHLKPNSRELFSYLQNRRSIRNYSSTKVDKQKILSALEAVRYAPTGKNRQLNHWVIISSPQKIQDICSYVIRWAKSLKDTNPEKYKSFIPLIEAWDSGVDRISRGAPHLALCCGPDDGLGKIDAIVATSHLELAFPALGIGSCWAGYILAAFSTTPEMKELIPIENGMQIHGALMFGYPIHGYHKIPARKPVSADWL